MGIPAGIGYSLGWAAETTYGTYQAPSKWLPVNPPQLKRRPSYYEGGGLRGGGLARPADRRVLVGEDAGGTVPMEVANKTLGLLLKALMGGTVTPAQQGSTAAYLASFPLTTPHDGKLTLQAGVPDTGGVIHPYTLLGSKIISAEFSCQIGGALMVSFEVDSRQMVENQTLATPSYPATRVFHWAQNAVKLGTYDSEAPVSGVRSVSVRVQRASYVNRFYAGAGGLKDEPTPNDEIVVSGTFETDYVDKTVFADRFATDVSTALDWLFVGPQIESPFNEQFRIRVPHILFTGDTPTPGGPGPIQPSHPWKAYDDGTHPLVTIETISTDTTL
jgi:hypothetical protein